MSLAQEMRESQVYIGVNTDAPSCRYASAIARPSPRLAPVTIATFPSSFPISVALFLSLQYKRSARFSLLLFLALPDAFSLQGRASNETSAKEFQPVRDPQYLRSASRTYSETIGTRLNNRPARSTPTTAPLLSRVKKPRCPVRAPSVMMYSSLSPGSRPKSNGA